MGLLSSIFSSGKPESKTDKKARINRQYEASIRSCQINIDNCKKAIENARWQLKMTKDKSWKLTIEDRQYQLKYLQNQMKQIKANKATALKVASK